MLESDVPAAYVGLWKRTLLETPALRDTTSHVFWLQTRDWHADIRIPADRPDLSAAGALTALDRAALLALTRQQGSAGLTAVEGDTCRWHRQVDFQPRNDFNDIGRMRFETPARLLEHGVEQEYCEVWERMSGSGGESQMIELSIPSQPRALMLRAGDFVMLVRDRGALLPAAPSLETLAADLNQAELIAALDLEISFGRRVGTRSWRIDLSTLPWREGELMSLRQG